MTNIAYPPRPVSLEDTLYLYGQSAADHLITFGGFIYTRLLTRYPQPSNLNTSLLDQNTLDYSESGNITQIAKTEVITDRNFIFNEELRAYIILRGTATVNVSYAIRGDGTTTTILDSSRITLLVKLPTGTENILAQEEYIFSSSPSMTGNAYSEPINAQLYLLMSSRLMSTVERLILRIETFGHASGAGGTNNRIKLLFGRGTNQTHVIMPITEVYRNV